MRGSFDGVNLYEFECLLTIESIAAGGNSVVKCDVGLVHRAIGLLKDEHTIVMITENRLITCIQCHRNF